MTRNPSAKMPNRRIELVCGHGVRTKMLIDAGFEGMGMYELALARGGEVWCWRDEQSVRLSRYFRRWMLQNESTDFTVSTTHAMRIPLTIGNDEE